MASRGCWILPVGMKWLKIDLTVCVCVVYLGLVSVEMITALVRSWYDGYWFPIRERHRYLFTQLEESNNMSNWDLGNF